jgi:hypothetical protein
MIIFSFDCAIKNLGFCCIEFDENWRTKAAEIINSLNNLYSIIKDISKDEFLQKSKEILTDTNNLLDNMFKLHYANTIDLISEKKVEEVKYSDIFKSLKYVLECLNRQLPKPDIVLIETQMSINDKARGISRYIEDMYSDVDIPDTEITFAIKEFPLITFDIYDTPVKKVQCINANLKNTYSVDLSPGGDYGEFISKYSNYTANKKHTEHNFKYYMNKTGRGKILKSVPNKLDDVSDAFMMAYAWLCHHKYIDAENGIPI